MKMLLTRSLGRVLVFGLFVAGAACEDPLTPQERIAGRYEATTLMVTRGGVTFDALAAGADLEITLHENGTTNGYFFAPGGDEDGGDFAADLTGTWLTNNDRVTFSHGADTFLRDVEFLVQDNQLVSNELGIQVVLTRR